MNSIWCCGWSGCCFSDAKMEVLLRNINGYGMGMVWICDEYVMDMVWVEFECGNQHMLLSYLQVGILGSLLPRRCVKRLHAHYESWHRRVFVFRCSRVIW